MTAGTITVIVANCMLAVVGVLQGVDWVHVAGSSTAGWVTAVLAIVNAAAHAVTGADGLLAAKTAGGPSNSTLPKAK